MKILSPEKSAVFFRDMANMLETGLSLSRIFFIMEESTHDPALINACRKIAEDLEAGRSLAAAFELCGVFAPIAVTALKAGERAGNLPVVMALLADYFDFMANVQKQFINAAVYPAVVLLILGGAFVYMACVVMPQVAVLLPAESMQGPMTKIFLMMGKSITVFWPAIVVLGAAMIILMVWARGRHRRVLEHAMMRLPVWGRIKKDLELGLCFFNLYVLQKSGIPLDAALNELSAGEGGVSVFHFEQCRQYLLGGLGLSEAFSRDGYFPRVIPDTIRLGEEMGRYEEYFERLFRYFYRSFEMRVNSFIALIQPALFIVCAAFIAGFACAFLKPVYANLTNMGMMLH
ncbi:MAG: type II secretion system F family protein [Candidatus Omnitrophica bacterium]|nr:type II secretion system F family protein [Candidatus Omnitrophota bacterium]